MRIFILNFLFCFECLAGLDVPPGWVEMKSLDPVILTWVKADPQKKLTEVPTLTVQSYSLTEKFRTFFQEHSQAGKCFDVQDKEWSQTWCESKNQAYVILSKNETNELLEHKKKLLAWIGDD